jgi:acyl dehydratase
LLEQFLMGDLNPGGENEPVFLEDLQVGQRFVSDTHRIDEEQIRAFAGQFDPQPFHLDAEAAKETFFGGLVASGWHTAAITMRLLVGGGLPIAGGIVGAGAEIAWPKPVRPGSTLHVESEILELRPSRSRPNRGVATVRSETRDQIGEVVQVLVAKLVVPRRTQPDMHGDPSSKESCTATGPAPHPALTETLPDPQHGRQRIDASPGEEQASGGGKG